MSREEQFEALADTLGEASFAYNEFDPSDEATTCIKRGTSVDEVAEYLIAAGWRKLSIDDATVERAARAMFAEEQCDRRQKLDVESNWIGRLDDRDRDEYRRLARAVLAAAVEAGQ